VLRDADASDSERGIINGSWLAVYAKEPILAGVRSRAGFRDGFIRAAGAGLLATPVQVGGLDSLAFDRQCRTHGNRGRAT